MDLSKYNFECQKAFHQGHQLAKSYGHQSLEVEHVAFALLRDHLSLIGALPSDHFLTALQTHLRRQSRVFGTERVGFGLRLDATLDDVEAACGEQLVDEASLWAALIKQSTTLKTVFQKLEIDIPRTSSAPKPQQPSRSGSVIKGPGATGGLKTSKNQTASLSQKRLRLTTKNPARSKISSQSLQRTFQPKRSEVSLIRLLAETQKCDASLRSWAEKRKTTQF